MPDISHKPRRRPSKTFATFIVIVVVGILYLGWSYFSGNPPWQQSQQGGTPKVSWLKKEAGEKKISKSSAESPAREKEPALHLKLDEGEPSSDQQNQCLQTADKIDLFFEHLDRQDYIHNYSLKGSTLDHFRGIINKLIANPPVVVRETDDLFAILNNMAHFFRILGPKDILLIKDVLIHERELIEPTMALFYKWSEIAPSCPANDLDIELPLPGLYEYAGYFINTLGGQSYLFRREVYLRLLIRYYSLLIIDRANSMDANRYGIDIRYPLDSLISEIQGNTDLIDNQTYLTNLIRLQENYQARYGGD